MLMRYCYQEVRMYICMYVCMQIKLNGYGVLVTASNHKSLGHPCFQYPPTNLLTLIALPRLVAHCHASYAGRDGATQVMLAHSLDYGRCD